MFWQLLFVSQKNHKNNLIEILLSKKCLYDDWKQDWAHQYISPWTFQVTLNRDNMNGKILCAICIRPEIVAAPKSLWVWWKIVISAVVHTNSMKNQTLSSLSSPIFFFPLCLLLTFSRLEFITILCPGKTLFYCAEIKQLLIAVSVACSWSWQVFHYQSFIRWIRKNYHRNSEFQLLVSFVMFFLLPALTRSSTRPNQ